MPKDLLDLAKEWGPILGFFLFVTGMFTNQGRQIRRRLLRTDYLLAREEAQKERAVMKKNNREDFGKIFKLLSDQGRTMAKIQTTQELMLEHGFEFKTKKKEKTDEGY